MNIGKNIQNLRKKTNMTQQDLADHLGISRSAISRMENKSSLDTELLLKISEAFNVPPIALLTDENDESCDYMAADVVSIPKSIRDLHPNNIDTYKKLPDRFRNFTRAIGIEIFNEILYCESKAIKNFSKELETNISSFLDNVDSSLKDNCIKLIENYTEDYLNELQKERS